MLFMDHTITGASFFSSGYIKVYSGFAGLKVKFFRHIRNVKGVCLVNLASLKLAFANIERAIKNALSCSYQKSMCYNLLRTEWIGKSHIHFTCYHALKFQGI